MLNHNIYSSRRLSVDFACLTFEPEVTPACKRPGVQARGWYLLDVGRTVLAETLGCHLYFHRGTYTPIGRFFHRTCEVPT